MSGICALIVSCALSLSPQSAALLGIHSTPPNSASDASSVFLQQSPFREGLEVPARFVLPHSSFPGAQEEDEVGVRKWIGPIFGGAAFGVTTYLLVQCGPNDLDFCALKKGFYGAIATIPGLFFGHIIEKATR